MINNENLMQAWRNHLDDWRAGKCKLMSWADFAAEFVSKQIADGIVHKVIEDEQLQGELHARD